MTSSIQDPLQFYPRIAKQIQKEYAAVDCYVIGERMNNTRSFYNSSFDVIINWDKRRFNLAERQTRLAKVRDFFKNEHDELGNRLKINIKSLINVSGWFQAIGLNPKDYLIDLSGLIDDNGLGLNALTLANVPLIGTQNGSNTTFNIHVVPALDEMQNRLFWLSRNGQLLVPNADYTFTSDRTIQLITANGVPPPKANEVLRYSTDYYGSKRRLALGFAIHLSFIGEQDGINTVFQLAKEPAIDDNGKYMVDVYRGGQYQLENYGYTFNSSMEITFTKAPHPNEILIHNVFFDK